MRLSVSSSLECVQLCKMEFISKYKLSNSGICCSSINCEIRGHLSEMNLKNFGIPNQLASSVHRMKIKTGHKLHTHLVCVSFWRLKKTVGLGSLSVTSWSSTLMPAVVRSHYSTQTKVYGVKGCSPLLSCGNDNGKKKSSNFWTQHDHRFFCTHRPTDLQTTLVSKHSPQDKQK